MKLKLTEALAELRGRRDNRIYSPEERCAFGVFLRRLQKTSEFDYLVGLIATNEPGFRSAALRRLRNCTRVDSPSEVTVARLKAALGDLTREADTVELAAQCMRLRIAAVEPELTALLTSGKLSDPTKFAALLADAATQRATVAATIPYLIPATVVPNKKLRSARIAKPFRRLLDFGTPEAVEPAAAALRAYLLLEGTHADDAAWVEAFARVADHSFSPFLLKIASSTRDTRSRECAVTALARLYPQKALTLALKLLPSSGLNEISVGLLQKYFDPNRRAEILAAVDANLRKARPHGELELLGRDGLELPAAQFLLDYLGREGRQLLTRYADRFTGEVGAWRDRRSRRFNLKAAVNEFAEAGAFAEPVEAVYDRIKRTARERHPHVLITEAELLRQELTAVRLATDYGGMAVTSHEILILDCALHSRGLFRPQYICQIGDERPARLRFVHADRVYEIALAVDSHDYDPNAAVSLVNRAVDDAGVKLRFLPMAEPGPFITFALAEPVQFKRLAAKYGIELDFLSRRSLFEDSTLDGGFTLDDV